MVSLVLLKAMVLSVRTYTRLLLGLLLSYCQTLAALFRFKQASAGPALIVISRLPEPAFRHSVGLGVSGNQTFMFSSFACPRCSSLTSNQSAEQVNACFSRRRMEAAAIAASNKPQTLRLARRAWHQADCARALTAYQTSF